MSSLAKNILDMLAITQSGRALAELGGVNEGTIRNWKHGKFRSGNKLPDFAAALGLKLSELIGEMDIPKKWWADFEQKFKRNAVTELAGYLRNASVHDLTSEQMEPVSRLNDLYRRQLSEKHSGDKQAG